MKIKYFKLQKGDIKDTKSNISKAKKIIKFSPQTNPEEGMRNFCDWFRKYYDFK